MPRPFRFPKNLVLGQQVHDEFFAELNPADSGAAVALKANPDLAVTRQGCWVWPVPNLQHRLGIKPSPSDGHVLAVARALGLVKVRLAIAGAPHRG